DLGRFGRKIPVPKPGSHAGLVVLGAAARFVSAENFGLPPTTKFFQCGVQEGFRWSGRDVVDAEIRRGAIFLVAGLADANECSASGSCGDNPAASGLTYRFGNRGDRDVELLGNMTLR